MQEVCGRWGSKMPIFYFTFNQKQKCLRGIVRLFLFYGQQKSSELDPVLDTMRHKLRRDQREVRIQIAAEQKWDARQELLPPSHARTASKKKKKLLLAK